MRSLKLLGVFALLACSSSTSTPPADTGAADTQADTVAIDRPAADTATPDAPPLDVAIDQSAPDITAPDASAPDTLTDAAPDAVTAPDTVSPDVPPAIDAPSDTTDAADAPGIDLVLPDVAPDTGAPEAATDGPIGPVLPDASDVGVDAACAMGTTSCGGACVDTSSSPTHCGACGNACCAGQVCSLGTCVFVCGAGMTVCGRTSAPCSGACVNTQTDARNCGACGTVCPAGATCNAGSCLACGGCPAGASCCGSTCVNTVSDAANCGACGRACAAGQACVGGTCGCPSGQTICDGACVDTRANSAHCGGCSQPCCAGNFCSAGACVVSCGPTLTMCPGPMAGCRGNTCANTTSDANNCGGCGVRCPTGQTCTAGVCGAAGFMALEPCTSASDYMMASTVRFGDAVGLAYSPRCVTVRAGTMIMFQGSFSAHPLTPSTRGTSGNPIPATSSGTILPVTFNATGYFPFYCGFHGSNAGGGMAGVVQVIP